MKTPPSFIASALSSGHGEEDLQVVGFGSGSSGSGIREELPKGGEVPFRRTGWWFYAGSPGSHDRAAVGTVETDRRECNESCFLSPYLSVPL